MAKTLADETNSSGQRTETLGGMTARRKKLPAPPCLGDRHCGTDEVLGHAWTFLV